MTTDVALPPGLSRETTIRRDAAGRWHEGGEPIDQPNVESAFDTWVDRAPDGRYCLKNDLHWVYVAIEGAPLFVRAVRVEQDRVWLRLSDGREEPLAPRTLRFGPDGALYCDARGGTLPARFDRAAQAQLAPVVDEDDAGPFVRAWGERVRPPSTDAPLAPLRLSP